MLASEIKAVSAHYRPLPLDLRVDFFLQVIVAPPFEKCIARGAFIRINTVCHYFATNKKIAITHLWHAIEPQTICHLIVKD